MARNSGPMGDSPQESLIGNRPTKHGGDMAVQSLNRQPAGVDDTPTKSVTGDTFFVDIPGYNQTTK